MRTRYLLLFGLVFLTACNSTSSLDQGDLKKLQGNWRLVYQQIDGNKIPDEQAARMFKGRMTFKRDKVVYAADLPGFYFEDSYSIDPAKRPHTIDLKIERARDREDLGSSYLGIYILRGDDLLICWNEQGRPDEFSAAAGTGNTLVVLKRARPKGVTH